MRYCHYAADEGPRYALVEDRDGIATAVEPMEPPPEDLAGKMLAARSLTHAFVPMPLSRLEEQGRLLAPVTPSKIVCVGRNYAEHAAELGNEMPAEPMLFFKPPSALLAPGGTIRGPAASRCTVFEGELAVVVGKACHRLKPDADVRSLIRGYTCVNDVTARDLRNADMQWTRGKGHDTFCPVGPTVTDEIDPSRGPVELWTRVNGETKQHGSTAELTFSVEFLVRYVSQIMTLLPGDLIVTGTPAGAGPMCNGDTIEIEVAGIGVLRNGFVCD